MFDRNRLKQQKSGILFQFDPPIYPPSRKFGVIAPNVHGISNTPRRYSLSTIVVYRRVVFVYSNAREKERVCCARQRCSWHESGTNFATVPEILSLPLGEEYITPWWHGSTMIITHWSKEMAPLLRPTPCSLESGKAHRYSPYSPLFHSLGRLLSCIPPCCPPSKTPICRWLMAVTQWKLHFFSFTTSSSLTFFAETLITVLWVVETRILRRVAMVVSIETHNDRNQQACDLILQLPLYSPHPDLPASLFSYIFLTEILFKLLDSTSVRSRR